MTHYPTATPTAGRQRNLSLECCKLLASFLVVFAHVPFPGPFGEVILCLARLSVPLFLTVSGWYSYRASSRTLAKRLGHILLLELTGSLLQIAWICFVVGYGGGNILSSLPQQIPSWETVKRWLLYDLNPYGDHLWYLTAAAQCYSVVWLYTRFTGENRSYRPLYLLGLGQLVLRFSLELSGKFYFPYYFWRNSWMMAMPLFFLGLALRQHQEALLQRLSGRTLLTLFLAGVALSIAQWHYWGFSELYVGILPAVASLMLLTQAHPGVPRKLVKAAGSFGFLSTWIYLLHLILFDVYLAFLQRRLRLWLGSAEAWAAPFLVLFASIAIALAIQALGRRRPHSKETRV